MCIPPPSPILVDNDLPLLSNVSFGAVLTSAIISSYQSEVMNRAVRDNLRLASEMSVCVRLSCDLVSFCVHTKIA